MSEIELKIPLSQEQFLSIYNFISGQGKAERLKFSPFEKIIKEDEYFSRYKTRGERIKNGEFEVIRIRTESYGGKMKSYFTTKRKSAVNGFEVNDEKETFIENPEVLRGFFIDSGFEIWFAKKKESFSSFCKIKNSGESYHVELEKVNGLCYVEIENTSCACDGKNEDSEDVRNKIFSGLEEIVRELGLDIKDNDPRSWAEILNSRKT